MEGLEASRFADGNPPVVRRMYPLGEIAVHLREDRVGRLFGVKPPPLMGARTVPKSRGKGLACRPGGYRPDYLPSASLNAFGVMIVKSVEPTRASLSGRRQKHGIAVEAHEPLEGRILPFAPRRIRERTILLGHSLRKIGNRVMNSDRALCLQLCHQSFDRLLKVVFQMEAVPDPKHKYPAAVLRHAEI